MARNDTQILELTVSGKSQVFVEVEPSLTTDGPMQKVAASGPLTAELSEVSSKLANIATSLEGQLNRIPEKASGMGLNEVALELGAKLKGGADIWIVKGDAEAHLKITLKWRRSG